MRVKKLLKVLETPRGYARNLPNIVIVDMKGIVYYTYKTTRYTTEEENEYIKAKKKYGNCKVYWVRIIADYDDEPYAEIIIDDKEV